MFTAPVFLASETPRGPYQAWENYDFYAHPPEAGLDRPSQLSWQRYGALAPASGGGPGAIPLVCERADAYADLPASVRRYLEAEAPTWTRPPADLDEVARLQAPE